MCIPSVMQCLLNAQHVLFLGGKAPFWRLALVYVFIIMDKTNSISPAVLYFVYLPDFKCFPFVFIFYLSAHLPIEFAPEAGFNLEAKRLTSATEKDRVFKQKKMTPTHVYFVDSRRGLIGPKLLRRLFRLWF